MFFFCLFYKEKAEKSCRSILEILQCFADKFVCPLISLFILFSDKMALHTSGQSILFILIIKSKCQEILLDDGWQTPEADEGKHRACKAMPFDHFDC